MENDGQAGRVSRRFEGDSAAFRPAVRLAGRLGPVVPRLAASRRARHSAIVLGLTVLSTTAAQSGSPTARGDPYVPDKYAARAGGRGAMADAGVREAIGSGLDWLARHQSDDGRWDADGFMDLDVEGDPCDGAGSPEYDVGVTSLCVLGFLADGSSMRGGPHAGVVARGVGWLREQQDPGTGRIGLPVVRESFYEHLIATLAVAEAYGMSREPELGRSVAAAVRFLSRQRSRSGGWRYDRAKGDSDTSATAWATLALLAARDFGIGVDDADLQAAVSWFDAMTDPKTGRTGYDRRGSEPSRREGEHAQAFPRNLTESLTAMALGCRLLLGQSSRRQPILGRQAELILHTLPIWSEDSGRIDFYYWSHATNALWQLGGEPWERWWSAVREALVPHQRHDGNFAGSWDPVCAWGDEAGRAYATAMAVLTLQAPYRFVPLREICPVPERPGFAALREAWLARRFDDVGVLIHRVDVERLDTNDRDAFMAVRERFEDVIAAAEDEVAWLRRSPDYHAARARLTTIETEFAGMPPAAAARRILDSYETDRAIRREIRAGDELERLLRRFDREEPAQRLKLVRALRRMARGAYRETQAAARAEEIAAELENR